MQTHALSKPLVFLSEPLPSPHLTVVRVEDLPHQQQEPLLRQAAHVQSRLPDKRHPQLLLQVTPLPCQLQEEEEEASPLQPRAHPHHAGSHLVQRVAEELCSSYFNVEEEQIHVDSLPARDFTDQAQLSNTQGQGHVSTSEWLHGLGVWTSYPGLTDHLLLRVFLDDGFLHHSRKDEGKLTEGKPEKSEIIKKGFSAMISGQ